MYEYIKGTIIDLTPASIVIENNNIGYFIHISVNTYSKLSGYTEATIFIHQNIREDSNVMYGFFDKHERSVFRLLVSVSGIGVNTGRMMLSSLTASEVESAILSDDVNVLKGVKGIGIKTAQRVIIELKDKLGKDANIGEIFASSNNTIKEEALSALVMLGFVKNNVTKVLDKILSSQKDINVETLIKMALKLL